MTHYALYLSQTQFFISLAFMLLFMALELGLSWVLFYFRIRTYGKARDAWMGAYRFWVRVFALAFIVSFAAAMPVLIQFGSLWPGLMAVMGEVAGPLLAAAMLSLFIFKSCFLGLMLFGLRNLSRFMHTVVVFMVALGVSFSSLCLLALVAWMHEPTGVALLDGRYLLVDWLEVLRTPALLRYAALFFASSFTVVAGFLIGLIAWQTMRRPASESERLALKTGSWIAVLALCSQLALVSSHYAWPVTTGLPDAVSQAVLAVQAVQDSDADALENLPETELWDAQTMAAPSNVAQAQESAAPVLWLAIWSYRLAMISGAFLLVLGSWTLLRLFRFGFDPHALSHSTRQLLTWAPGLSWLTLLGGAAFVFFGTAPYIIGEQVLFTDVMARHSVWTLGLGTLMLLFVYIVCFYGFYRMVRHVVRFGVVPVARHRGRA